jgi:HAD domain in Swiss Army Knife RNA repair proteins
MADKLIILLDIDGVLVTTPSWRQPEILPDGFMKFNENAVRNLAILFKKTNASIVLTTTHRINFSVLQWKEIFRFRGLEIDEISKLNDTTELSQLHDRGSEIRVWFDQIGYDLDFIIIDDDLSINGLPENIKRRWIQTKPLIGFDNECLERSLQII